MEDGNHAGPIEDRHGPPLTNSLADQRVTTNGHDCSSDADGSRDSVNVNYESQEDKFRKRINPLKIHLGSRPFVDNSINYQTGVKRKKTLTNKVQNADKKIPVSRQVPRTIPNQPRFGMGNHMEDGMPVPRLIPKSQLSQFKKGKIEKPPYMKDYTQYLGIQPSMVQFKCSKCCALFQTLQLLNEHQQICRVQVKGRLLTPVAVETTDGTSRTTKQVFLCSACGTYYESCNLFLHMREMHNRHICLYCLGMFSKAKKLSAHLIAKHNVTEYIYSSKEDFCKNNESCYLMCCTCAEVYSEQDSFANHDCNNVKPIPVPVLISKNSANSNLKQVLNKNHSAVNNGPGRDTPSPQSNESTRYEIKNTDNEVKNELVPPIIIRTTPQPKVPDSGAVEKTNEFCDSNLRNVDYSKQLDVPNKSHAPNVLSQIHINNKLEKDLFPEFENKLKPLEINNTQTSTSSSYSPVPESKADKCQKDCGIKLKLSLNNPTKSPVIINSTVDPSVGKQNPNKPPSRVRRPPKRYEKEPVSETRSTQSMPSTPSIRMTICDKANNSFVKNTVIESMQTPTSTFIYNHFESPMKPSVKPDTNAIKSTIYDNAIEEINTLNRVPKLTVRVPKELLDKDSSSDYSSDSDTSDKLMVDEIKMPDNVINNAVEALNVEEIDKVDQLDEQQTEQPVTDTTPFDNNQTLDIDRSVTKEVPPSPAAELLPSIEALSTETNNTISELTKTDLLTEEPTLKLLPAEENIPPKPLIDEVPVTELTLDKPLDKYPLKDLLKVFLASTIFNCKYCNHVRKIAVNCEQLSLHMVAQHRFTATVDSITAEELLPETFNAKVSASAEDLKSVFINLDSYDSIDVCETPHYDHIFECFQCFFKTPIHKDLYLHNRKLHQKTILLCIMCKTNFYSYSELLCHLCPGTYDSDIEIKFRCYLCNFNPIPSSFRLMVHLRKIHHTCDVCLEFCQNQYRLSNHVWKHKLHHMCYRCGIAYRNKNDIFKHLFWKHGTESVTCKKCLLKKWPHIFHFCTPPTTFICEECSLTFTRAVCLRVHKRFHSEEYPHICQEEGCTEKFVSKKLLLKHEGKHKQPTELEAKEQNITIDESAKQESKDAVPVIDLVDEKSQDETIKPCEDSGKDPEKISKKSKKKKNKDNDLLLDVNLPALNLSESDSSDESDSGRTPPPPTLPATDDKEDIKEEPSEKPDTEDKLNVNTDDNTAEVTTTHKEENIEPLEEEKPSDQKVLDIWDNFKKYQAKVERQKTPPLVPIKKHVCESDHDYCLVPMEMNGDDASKSPDKKSKRIKNRTGDPSSSSSSSDSSSSSCSCGPDCSCSSGSSSSSSSSSDESTDSEAEMNNRNKLKKPKRKTLPDRRTSCGSQVDVLGAADTPALAAENTEPPVAESDLETDESDTDEEFYDEHPQRLANKLLAEKRNRLLLLASVAPSDNGSVSGDIGGCVTPVVDPGTPPPKERSSGKKKSKKKKKKNSKRSERRKDAKQPNEVQVASSPFVPNKITISLHSQKVQISESPRTPITAVGGPPSQNCSYGTPRFTSSSLIGSSFGSTPFASAKYRSTPYGTAADSSAASDSKRASKRRRVPNKFYGYSSDEEGASREPPPPPLKPHLPPKLEWRKEDLPARRDTTPVRREIPPPRREVPPPRRETPPARREPPQARREPPQARREPPASRAWRPPPPRPVSPPRSESPESPWSPDASPPLWPAAPSFLAAGASSLPYAFGRPPTARAPREGESVYCYCRCPYDEVSEMIACDADGCSIEWFHFECVGIMVPPKGKWYCPECRKRQGRFPPR